MEKTYKSRVFLNSYIYDFQQFEKIVSIAKNIFNGKITLNNNDKDQGDLISEIMNFKKKKTKNLKEKSKKKYS